MSRLRLMFAEALRSLGANLSTTISATFTVLIAMFLLGSVIALGTWALSFSDYAKSKLQVKVLFCAELDVEEGASTCKAPATTTQINAALARIQGDPRIKEFHFVSKAEALERMRKQRPELVNDLVSNPLPDAYEITPRDGSDIKAISAKLRTPPLAGVRKVRDGEEISDRIVSAAKVISTAAGAATIILLVAATLLIGNTIRLSIFSRRREIEVMKLVGATNWFVRGPFMLEGLICGILGSVAAIVFLLLSRAVLHRLLDQVDTYSTVQAISFGLNALVLLAVGLLVGAAGSGLTLRRFLQI